MNVCNVECVHSYLAQITAQLKKEEKKRHSHVSQLLGTDKSKENATVPPRKVSMYNLIYSTTIYMHWFQAKSMLVSNTLL